MSFTSFTKSGLYVQRSKNLIKLVFDFKNPNTKQEYEKIESKLRDEYFNQKGSMITIMKKFDIPSSRTLDILFREFDIEANTLSKATNISITEGRSTPLTNFNTFVHLRHVSWDNNKFMLRSNNEKAFAEILDQQQETYKVEELRIKYFDTNRQQERIAIPDFYLPNQNKIVEVKSTYWLNIENMKCKKKAYTDLGYSFALCLDHQLINDW